MHPRWCKIAAINSRMSGWVRDRNDRSISLLFYNLFKGRIQHIFPGVLDNPLTKYQQDIPVFWSPKSCQGSFSFGCLG